MKKSFLIFIIYFSTFSLKAQSNFLDYFPSHINDQQINNEQIKNQQKDILKKEKVKKTKTSSYVIGHLETKTSDRFIFFDSNGNIQKNIFDSPHEKRIHSYTYNESNSIESKKTTVTRNVNALGDYTFYRYPNKIYYSYDDKNRLIKKKTCEDNNGCKIEQIKYFGNKVYTYYRDKNEEIEKIEVIERKDSIERKIELNKNNEIVQKSIIFYNKDSLKLKEERFKNDTLIYREENKIENNKIIQTIKSSYSKEQDSNKMRQSVDGAYFVYNSDHSIKTIKSVRTITHNDGLWITRYEYVYNKKGLLIEIREYIRNNIRYLNLYEYEMW